MREKKELFKGAVVEKDYLGEIDGVYPRLVSGFGGDKNGS